jgi:hypothetical protein
MNLLKETVEELSLHGKTVADVKWVGTEHCFLKWENFERLANREYDDGYGSREVNENLIVVGENWWIERHEYDGSEWWEYKTMPRKPQLEAAESEIVWMVL